MGREAVLALIEAGHDLTLFNRGTTTVDWSKPVDEVHGDRNDPSALAELQNLELDAVLDFSSYTAEHTASLVNALPHISRYVYVSSGAVYRPQPVVPWRETTPEGPWSLWGAYAENKLASERLLRRRRTGLVTTCIRLPYVLGPRNYADREEFVFNRLLDESELLVPGDGNGIQQFISARDAGATCARAVDVVDESGWHAYNAAFPDEFASLNGFIDLCADLTDKEPNVRRVGGGPTGTGVAVFDASNAVFPFPNVCYGLDLRRGLVDNVIVARDPLRQVLTESLQALISEPDRRVWARTPAEKAHLER